MLVCLSIGGSGNITGGAHTAAYSIPGYTRHGEVLSLSLLSSGRQRSSKVTRDTVIHQLSASTCRLHYCFAGTNVYERYHGDTATPRRRINCLGHITETAPAIICSELPEDRCVVKGGDAVVFGRTLRRRKHASMTQ